MANKSKNIKKTKDAAAPKHVEREKNERAAATAVLARGLIFNENDYNYSDAFVPGDSSDPMSCHTTPELVECLTKNPKIQIEARVICAEGSNGDSWKYAKMGKNKFLEFSKTRTNSIKLREAVDNFSSDDTQFGGSGSIGDDFTPLLGGPFNKQLYYTDYLRMHAVAFHAWNHDPFGHAVIEITKNFVLGRGFRVDWRKNQNQILWDAFCKVNQFDQLIEWACKELSIYGEVMMWALPDFRKYIVQRPSPGDTIPLGMLPRYRLIDPSVIWEIVTHPEDITRVLYYQWVAPTQYQIYTDGQQPSLKFLYQQIPAEEVLHYKVNSVSNEKRGRSDLFPALGYMKRLRDSVNYSIIGLQKAAAWAIDTTIQGDQGDLDQYVIGQQQAGTIAPAGSEFVHTDAIKRDYLSNEGASHGGNSSAFEWTFSMAAMATQIPIAYFGTHLGGEQTRAGALVATEPVALKMEARQNVIKRIILDICENFSRQLNIMDDTPEVTFPEIVRDDRSQKLRDVALAQSQRWIKPSRAAEIAAKELSIDDYDYSSEVKAMKTEIEDDPFIVPQMTDPLTSPGGIDKNKSSLDSTEKNKIKKV